MCKEIKNPRIKRIYPIYRLNNSVFRVGAQLGITREFEDPEGKLYELALQLDGKTLFDVIENMINKFPDLTKQDVLDGIQILAEEELLEESWENTFDIKERYLPNVNYFSRFIKYGENPYFLQKKLNESKILLLGLGGGGSNILTQLSGLGPKLIKIVDYDRVEESNLGRQVLYTEQDLGKLKVEVAYEKIKKMNSDIIVESYNKKIVTVNDVLEVIGDGDIDLVICAIDEPPFKAQKVVNEAIIKAGIPCVFGASQVSRGRVFTVYPKKTGCFDCLSIHYSKKDPQFVEQFVGFKNSNFNGPTIAYVPAIFQLTAALVDEVVRVLTGYATVRSLSTQYEINYEDASSFTHPSWERYELECPTCGKGKEEDWEIFKVYEG